ncbi:MAG: hypothetical protein A2665_01105 [Candidatus Zambryskibacteria bacterium RIFCSPHIGHO2_01_FULL_46_30]|uniref:Glycosyl transferase family 1 domain-containing protein n=1 Tax=Candidatus Zambryskibacteria bacterium RIFCSPHIGHO2_01_FULL_46_30 TaxID=1802739 RepID=A0A1G2T1H7_9BACT|nr:MAG: hypothetical protein A2665_01105 [Candidatus Zambryskibacteria bacterium RIFCSPHIGHO2_01_FULL_46_30]OHB06086.1 MAG: hypothetical protein A3B22_02205 [Candidatus Zambryskibacteria bacterium RIFCSPLOWO2_01_FULL_47_33]
MKLVYLAQIRLPSRKAHSVQIMNMCLAFANCGVSVNLIVPRWRPTEISEPFAYYGVKRNFSITRILTPRLAQFGKYGFMLETALFAFVTVFYSLCTNPEIVYSRSLLPLLIISPLKNKVLVWETHTRIKGWLPKFLLNLVGRSKIKIVTITRTLKSDLIQLGIKQERIMVSPDGVNLAQFANLPSKDELRRKLGLPLDKTIIAYVGRYRTMGQEKGVGGLIKAYATIEKKQKNILLLLVGIHEGEKLEVEELMKRNLVSNYKIKSIIPSRIVSHYLCASDILVMNYPSANHYLYYMSPLKLFEYMASGNPIVSSDLPSIREVLNESNAILVPPDDINVLIKGIENLIKDKPMGDKIAAKAYKDVQNYTWANRAKNILNFI